MAISEVYDFYRRMEDEHIILSFKGVFTAELLTSILNILESKMIRLEIPTKKKRRVFNILVECFQNLYHHIEELNEDKEAQLEKKTALVIVKYIDGDFIIKTGNYVNKELIPNLKEKLEAVNKLDQEGLRDLYRSNLQNEHRTAKGTAGLGLIDIARKSKKKLEYDFIDVNNNTEFFCLDVFVE